MCTPSHSGLWWPSTDVDAQGLLHCDVCQYCSQRPTITVSALSELVVAICTTRNNGEAISWAGHARVTVPLADMALHEHRHQPLLAQLPALLLAPTTVGASQIANSLGEVVQQLRGERQDATNDWMHLLTRHPRITMDQPWTSGCSSHMLPARPTSNLFMRRLPVMARSRCVLCGNNMLVKRRSLSAILAYVWLCLAVTGLPTTRMISALGLSATSLAAA
jgi:hypothetical protein